MSDGEDALTKTVKPFGNGAHVILPKELIDETVRVIYPPEEEETQ